MSIGVGDDRPAEVQPPGWRRVGRALVRDLAFKDFDEAFAFLNRVANEAVDYSRRPDMCIFAFNRVRLTIANPIIRR